MFRKYEENFYSKASDEFIPKPRAATSVATIIGTVPFPNSEREILNFKHYFNFCFNEAIRSSPLITKSLSFCALFHIRSDNNIIFSLIEEIV